VHLGERFPLFPPAATRLDHTIAPRLPLFTAQLRFETDGLLPALPIQFTTDAWPTSAAEAFTPFEPALGYTVTWEDLDPSRRPAKYRRLRASTSRRSLSGHPLTLCAFLETLDLNRDTDPNLDNALMTYGPVGAGDLPLALYDLMSYTPAC